MSVPLPQLYAGMSMKKVSEVVQDRQGTESFFRELAGRWAVEIRSHRALLVSWQVVGIGDQGRTRSFEQLAGGQRTASCV